MLAEWDAYFCLGLKPAFHGQLFSLYSRKLKKDNLWKMGICLRLHAVYDFI